MKIVFNGVKMELDMTVTKEQKEFLNKMRRKGLILTYYPADDSTKGKCIQDVTMKIDSGIKL